MKIAVVSDTAYPWFLGGKEARYRDLLAQLREFGSEIEYEFFTMKWWGKEVSAPVGYKSLCPPMRIYNSSGRRSVLQATLFAASCFRLLHQRIDLIETDQMPILHLLPLFIVAKIKNIPLVVTWHEFWGPQYWRKYLGLTRGAVGALFERCFLNLATTVICAGPDTYAQVKAFRAERTSLYIAPNFKRVEVSKNRKNSDELAMVFVGRLISHKNVDKLLHLTVALRKMGVKATLKIIGMGPAELELKILAKKLEHSEGREDRIFQFLGSVREDVLVKEQVTASTFFISASDREGFGFAVAESLALGTPCIVSTDPSNGSQQMLNSSDLGLAVDFNDLQAVIKCILDLRSRLGSPSEIQTSFFQNHPTLQWGQMARAYVEAYTNERSKLGKDST